MTSLCLKFCSFQKFPLNVTAYYTFIHLSKQYQPYEFSNEDQHSLFAMRRFSYTYHFWSQHPIFRLQPTNWKNILNNYMNEILRLEHKQSLMEEQRLTKLSSYEQWYLQDLQNFEPFLFRSFQTQYNCHYSHNTDHRSQDFANIIALNLMVFLEKWNLICIWLYIRQIINEDCNKLKVS